MITWNKSDFNGLIARVRESVEAESVVLRYSKSDHARFIEASDARGNKVPFNAAAMHEVTYLGTRDPYEDMCRWVQRHGTKVMNRYVVIHKSAASQCVMIGFQYMGTEKGIG